jgi:hypothetical protein
MATIIGTYPNTYDINGKYVIVVEGNIFYNQDYQEEQTGYVMVGNGRIVVICDTLDELLSYIEENNLTLYNI